MQLIPINPPHIRKSSILCRSSHLAGLTGKSNRPWKSLGVSDWAKSQTEPNVTVSAHQLKLALPEQGVKLIVLCHHICNKVDYSAYLRSSRQPPRPCDAPRLMCAVNRIFWPRDARNSAEQLGIDGSDQWASICSFSMLSVDDLHLVIHKKWQAPINRADLICGNVGCGTSNVVPPHEKEPHFLRSRLPISAIPIIRKWSKSS